MHPYLIGFWSTAGPAGVVLFALFYLRDSGKVDWSQSPIAVYIPVFVLALPVLSMLYIYFRTLGSSRPDSLHRKRKRKFKGGLVGMVLLLALSYSVIDVAMSPPPPKPSATPDEAPEADKEGAPTSAIRRVGGVKLAQREGLWKLRETTIGGLQAHHSTSRRPESA